MKYNQKRKREKLPRVLEVMPLHKVPENMKRDKKLKAMKGGKRKAKSGKIYFERRSNRADKRPSMKL